MEPLCIPYQRQLRMSVFNPRLWNHHAKSNNQHLGRNLAMELGPRNITSNIIAPGFFPSKMASGLIEILGGESGLAEDNPRKRLGEPEDIAGVMIFLCSPAANYM